MRATRVALLIPSFLLALNLASVQAATFYWDTDGTSTGDSTSTGAGLGGTASWSTATPARWWDGVGGSALVVWTEGNDAVFWGTAGTVTLSGARTAGNVTFKTTGYILSGAPALTIGTAGGGFSTDSGVTATANCPVAGTVAITKSGTGTLVLGGVNTFTSQLSVKTGTISIATINNASVTGTLGNSANSVALGDTGGVTGTLAYTGATASSTKKFTMASGGTGAFDVPSGTTLTISGVIDGTGALSKTGAGQLTLSGVDTWTGGYSVSGGKLLLSNSGNTMTGAVSVSGGSTLELAVSGDIGSTSAGAGNVTLNNGTLQNDDPSAVAAAFLTSNRGIVIGASGGTLNLSSSGAILQYDGVISGTGNTLTKSGPGELRVSTSCTFGKLVVNGGLYRIANTGTETGFGAVPGSTDPSAILVKNGAALGISITITTPAARGITLGTASGDVATIGLNASWTVNSAITGPGGLTLNGNGFGGSSGNTLTLGAANTYGGPTTLNGCTLVIGAVNALPDTALVIDTSNTFTTQQINVNNNQTVASLAGGNANGTGSILIASGKTLTVGDNNTSTSYNGGVTGSGTFTKVGSGTFTISPPVADWALTGPVNINAGTIKYGSSTAGFSSSSTVTIASGATLDMNSINDTFGALAGAGNVINMGTLTLAGTASTTFSGTLSGSAAFSKSAASTGNLTLTGDSSATYTGQITANAGTITVQNAGALGNTAAKTVLASGACLNFNSGTSLGINEPIDIAGVGNGTSSSAGAIFVQVANTAITFGGTITLTADASVSSSSASGTSSTYSGSPAFSSTSSTLTLNGGSGGTKTIPGVIALGTGGLTKLQGGTWVLSAANTYSGPTTIGAGTLSINSLANVGGGSSALGAPTTAANGTIAIGSAATAGTLQYTGSGHSSDRGIDLAGTTGGATIDASGTGALSLTSPFTASGSGAKTLTLTGSSTAANTIAGAVVDSGGGGTAVTKSGAGTWVMSSPSSYSGATRISGGTLSINSLANVGGGTSALGAPTTAANGTIAIGSTTTAGTLSYTGSGHSTDRVIDLAGTTGGATIDASGSGALTFTSPFTASGSGAKTLTLTGSSTGANTVNAVVDSGGGSTALTKSGTGKWVLSGTSSYSGLTTVSTGTLLVNGSIGGGGATVASGATLGGSGTIGGTVTVVSGGFLSPGGSIGTLTVSASPTLSGTTVMELDNSAVPNADKLVVSGNPLAYDGTLTINNIGPALAGGEVFDLFDATGFSGSFATISTLPTIPASDNWYLGDLNANGKIYVNQPPNANNKSYSREKGVSLKIAKADLVSDATDPDSASGDSVSFDALTGLGTEGTITQDATYIYYEPNTDNSDTLQYRVKDTRGGFTTKNIAINVTIGTGQGQTIVVTGSSATVTFAGVPGVSYDIQRSTDLMTWTTLSTMTAPADGLFSYTDNFSDLGSPPPMAFYRLQR